ncbi:pilus assembly protein TadG-related protein [Acidithiobacillus sp. AMEEHan]|uniref:pilus assembly protein TadG-related protein n=1 Tax=Acidithiobacillus sp. AMEEHan TaxID=2994951 RepID=UPI0027E435B9|nr:pilus assembly protein TadG-related protein [Acidithiobacillus sp. AMEEHan]
MQNRKVSCPTFSLFPRRKRGKARREQGQAALLAVLLIPVAIAGVLLVFNTGQLTSSKLRVQNAADAAAFSAMELQARQMNLDAYLNRAMLTNQIAIGQAVSILSWSRYVRQAGENIQTPLRAIQAVASLIGAGGAVEAYRQAIEANAKIVYATGQVYALPFLAVASGADVAYSGASEAFNLALANSTPNGALQKTVEQIVRLNAGPKARVLNFTAAGLATTVAPYWAARRNYVTRWGENADANGSDPGGRARMASMINQGSQAFTVNRDHDVERPLTINALVVRIGTHKSGGSQFAPNANSDYVWSGADSVSTQVQIFGPFCGRIIPRLCWKTTYSDSWARGGSWAGDQGNFDYNASGPRNWSDPRVNPQASGEAKTVQWSSFPVYQGAWSRDSRGMSRIVSEYASRDMALLGQKGISPYRDLVWQDQRPGADLTDSAPRYIVVVDLPKTEVRDSVTALGISHDSDATNTRLGWLNMHLTTQGAGKNPGVRAAAAAQVYFRRPAELWPRSDGLDERANLFSPFWTARLVDLTPTEKAQVLALNIAE